MKYNFSISYDTDSKKYRIVIKDIDTGSTLDIATEAINHLKDVVSSCEKSLNKKILRSKN